MKSHETTIKVRYGETDQMGYAHPAYFAMYFEVSRMELLRDIGINYKELEESGVIMPIISMKSEFISPIVFDDVLEIKTSLKILSESRMVFNYKVYNQNGKLTCKAKEMLVLLDKESHKPIRKQDIPLMEMAFVES